MGCTTSTARRNRRRPTFKGARVVHINGYVEEFVGGEVTVGQVTCNSPKAMVCTSGELCSLGFNPLPVHNRLEHGRLYLLLPSSVFQSGASPLEHALLAARLAGVAVDRRTPVDFRLVGEEDGCGEPEKKSLMMGSSSSPSCSSSSKLRSWKPVLDSIQERTLV